MKGLDINLRGVTRGVHFDMIRNCVKDGGTIDYDLLFEGGYQVAQRTAWGVTYKVKFYWGAEDKMLYAEVLQ